MLPRTPSQYRQSHHRMNFPTREFDLLFLYFCSSLLASLWLLQHKRRFLDQYRLLARNRHAHRAAVVRRRQRLRHIRKSDLIRQDGAIDNISIVDQKPIAGITGTPIAPRPRPTPHPVRRARETLATILQHPIAHEGRHKLSQGWCKGSTPVRAARQRAAHCEGRRQELNGDLTQRGVYELARPPMTASPHPRASSQWPLYCFVRNAGCGRTSPVKGDR
jgi:hypothetical protein